LALVLGQAVGAVRVGAGVAVAWCVAVGVETEVVRTAVGVAAALVAVAVALTECRAVVVAVAIARAEEAAAELGVTSGEGAGPLRTPVLPELQAARSRGQAASIRPRRRVRMPSSRTDRASGSGRRCATSRLDGWRPGRQPLTVTVLPSAAQLQELQHSDISGPVQMLNLLRFAGDEGRASYATYGEKVLPFLQKVGGRLVLRADAHHVVIGPEGEHWDEMLVVEYPSVQAFIEMAMDPDYLEVAAHRTAALSDSRLVACSPA
jgi:uncharacterized protein (DUF1330 family)